MGCTSSKESGPRKPKRAVLYGSNTSLPRERYLADPAPKTVALPKTAAPMSSANNDTRGSGEAARPKETFEAYARRGVIRQSALFPEETPSKRTQQLSQKKRVGGYEKYTRE